MQTTEEFLRAVGRHEDAIRSLSSLLERYRGEAPQRTGLEAEIDAAADLYELTSAEVTGVITARLVISPPGGADQALREAGLANLSDLPIERTERVTTEDGASFDLATGCGCPGNSAS